MRVIAYIAFTFVILSTAFSDTTVIPHTPVFTAGEGGYHTYRIPSLFLTQDGTLLAFCEGRKESASDTGDIDLLMRRSTDNGVTWSAPQVIWDDGGNTCGNPCPVQDEATGKIWLLLTHNPGDTNEGKIVAATGSGTRTVWVSHSVDDGQIWTAPIEITNTTKEANWTWYATGPGVGIQLKVGKHAGRMVVPCDHKSLGDLVGYHSHVIYSDDHGATWAIGGISGDGANECQVIERNSGELLLNMRRAANNDNEGRVLATSADAGMTWGANTHDVNLPEPRCQASFIRCAAAGTGDTRVLFSNPADAQKRQHFKVRLSEDEGATWPYALELHAGPAAYSSLAAWPDGYAACLYERGEKHPYESIVFTRFLIDDIKRVGK